ncbi:MAG: Glyoxalase/bleomycin resistance protein/dioxygenase [Firmicutes bacterium]|nr:Glyoxalase/bleomycin resistance protein/dioxygenase [Bacillota bacterium]
MEGKCGDGTKKHAVSIRPLHCGVSVPNIEESIAWYQEMLGFTLVSNQYIPALMAKVAFLEHGDFKIELFEVENASPLPEERRFPNCDIKTHGTKHVAYAVADIHQVMSYLKSRNVDVALDIFQMEGELVGFIRDNAGNLIEIIQEPTLF